MIDSGWEFGVSLGHLMSVGKIQLPNLAYAYATANRQVAYTAVSDSSMFSGRVPDGLAAPTGETYRAWSELRDALQDALARTASSLEEAGRIIVHVASVYADADASAKKSMGKFYSDNKTYGLASGDKDMTDKVPGVLLPS
ncbi:hypothetical protein GCM10022220_27110 [Actinocatenispora rupis]|uniref:Excreted virulence factor EspC, type VII ESX diderm n=1 Tax=Actinocatenispora rupis TaxID=519421 RepID=A0A8J3JAV4_9ACTN|nr:hypothetical protein Aru02nite_22770 [Actinocatenispora rupis]